MSRVEEKKKEDIMLCLTPILFRRKRMLAGKQSSVRIEERGSDQCI
jgi:hypothetical protein